MHHLLYPATAHSPSTLAVTYDRGPGILRVAIVHPVEKPATHYVLEVGVESGDLVLPRESYTSQPSRDIFAYDYRLPLQPGESVQVTARCNTGGAITREYTVGPPGDTEGDIPATAPPEPVSLWVIHALPAGAGLVLILAVALLPVYGQKIPGWFRYHVMLALSGGVLAAVAIGLVVSRWLSSGSPPLPLAHVSLGAVIVLVLLATILAGVFRNRKRAGTVNMRTNHVWLGRSLVALAFSNVLPGLAALFLL